MDFLSVGLLSVWHCQKWLFLLYFTQHKDFYVKFLELG